MGSITSNGSGSAFNTTSDGQLKANRSSLFADLDIDAIVAALDAKAYDWLDRHGVPTGERGYGLIAQEVHAIFPSAVTVGTGAPGEADYQPWQLDYSKLVPILLAKIQLMETRLSDLEGKSQ